MKQSLLRKIHGIAIVACMLVWAMCRQARAFEVSGFHFDDFHKSSSPPTNYYRSGGSNNNNHSAPDPSLGIWHNFTPEEIARENRENNARYRQTLALIKPANQGGFSLRTALPEDSLRPNGPAFFTLGSGEAPWNELEAVHTSVSTVVAQRPSDLQTYSSVRSAPRIGAFAEVRGEVYIVTPDGHKYREKPGMPTFLGSHIVTGHNSRVQVMLLDQTVFTLGPDSDMVLDEFVYAPDTSAGKVTAKLIKGIFRFVTGQVAHRDPASMKIRWPSGGGGIRGTEFEVSLDEGTGNGYVKLFYGKLEITEDKTGETIEMDSGQMVTFNRAGNYGEPEPLDSDVTNSKVEAAGKALYLLRAAAALEDNDDKEFLTQQAGSVMERQPVPLEIPASVETTGDDAKKFYSLQQAVEVKIAAFAHFRRQRRWAEQTKGDLTEVLRHEEDAREEVVKAWNARQALIENGPER